ncbi:PREDICTED: calcium/calmodulin-dependent protein kinase kinase 1-like [Priapulus caudatus]|uniref:Calcium/calmodulin-dependent protein kinase kinase 1-like n=1 Tax=Priapulus caudatus TaxID=37621 RepID=A0ABM1EI27_PRICU|nr:PREDICTED: calcium/calmodulin-dependent protein kinase kinase 1-like [Priapulus caudatus]
MKILSKKKLIKKGRMRMKGPPREKGRAPVTNPLERVYREIAILKKLNHPNVVRLVECKWGSWSLVSRSWVCGRWRCLHGSPLRIVQAAEERIAASLMDRRKIIYFLVFELVERGAVIEVPTDTPLSEKDAWTHFRDVLLGLEYLHMQKILHMDIKPENLLLGDDGHVKIADFGVSNQFETNDLLTSSTGTPAFTAPEALRENKGKYSGMALDIWALGITLYCFVYGQVVDDPKEDHLFLGAFLRSLITRTHTEILCQPAFTPLTLVIQQTLNDLIRKMLRKIGRRDRFVHPWVTSHDAFPFPQQQQTLITVSVAEVDSSIKHVPRLATLILIKRMLHKRSFKNPFRRTRRNSNADRLGFTGRFNSAPCLYNLLK